MTETPKNTHPVIYTKNNCMPCAMTKKWLTNNDIGFVDNYYGNVNESNNVEVESTDEKKRKWSEEKITKLKDKYLISSLPFVKVVDEDGETLDYWSGFRPDKMKEWFKK